jgi:hypothetical protein
MDAWHLLSAYGRAMSAQTALLEAQLALLVELATPAPESSDTPAGVACPHPDDARIDLATLAHPRRFACRVCGVTIDGESRQEVSHGSTHG